MGIIIITYEYVANQDTDGYGGNNFEKRKVLRRERKMPWENCQQAVEDQSVTIEKSWMM